MGLLTPVDDCVGWFKGLFHGPEGSGKTFTAVELACAIHQVFGGKKPIAAIDTEGGVRFRKDAIVERTGHAPVCLHAANLDMVLEAMREAESEGHEVLIIDSITEIWKAVQKSYLLGLARRLRRRPEDTYLDLSDIQKINDIWAPFAEFFRTANIHIIGCGRRGFEWDNIEDEDKGITKLAKVGTKMKVQNEFGYDSDVAFEFELIQEEHPLFLKAKEMGVVRSGADRVSMCTCIKDRWDLIMGHRTFNATGEFFMPILRKITPQTPVPIDMDSGVADLDDNGRMQYRADKICALEAIENNLIRACPSTSGKDRAAKIDLIEAGFGTTAWAGVKSWPLRDLQAMLPHVAVACKELRDGKKIEDVRAALEAKRLDVFPPGDDGESVRAAADDTASQLDEALDGGGGEEALAAAETAA